MAVLFGLLFAWPLFRRWLPAADRLTVTVAAFGFSAGALSLWLLLLALPRGALSPWTGLALPVAAFGLGMWSGINKLQAADHKPQGKDHKESSASAGNPKSQSQTPNYVSRLTHYALLAAIAAPLIVIAVNVLYYPFYYPDTLSRYALFARRIFEAGGLTEAVQGYPLLVSMGYLWAFVAAGGVADRLAGLVSALFAAGTVGVTFVLARALYGRRVGLVAAFLAATSTLFVIWATSGYVDIPTGFYFALCALFAWRWLETGAAREALFCGAAAGLAIWTKQAGLAILPSLAGVLALSAWQAHRQHRLLVRLRGQRSVLALGRPRSWADYLREAARGGALFALAILLISGPWYVRNYLLGGPCGVVPLPGEFYAAQADHRLITLLPFAARPAEWGWPFALAALAGLLWVLYTAAFGAPAEDEAGGRFRPLFLLAFIGPYHLAWWWAFSYESRFLLTLLPFYALLAGRVVDWGIARINPALPRGVRGAANVAAGGLCLALALLGMWPRLGAVYHLLREPLATEHDIRLRLRPDQTLTVDYLNETLTPGVDSVLLMDGSYEYFLTRYKTAVFYPVTLAETRDWDYVVVPGWAAGIYTSLGHDKSEFWLGLADPANFREVYRAPVEGGSTVYTVVPAGN